MGRLPVTPGLTSPLSPSPVTCHIRFALKCLKRIGLQVATKGSRGTESASITVLGPFFVLRHTSCFIHSCGNDENLHGRRRRLSLISPDVLYSQRPRSCANVRTPVHRFSLLTRVFDPELMEDGGVEQESEEELCGSRSSLERQGHRGNTTVHVCWHRNTSVSMVDFSVAVEVPRRVPVSCSPPHSSLLCLAQLVRLSCSSCRLLHEQRIINPMSFVLFFFSCPCLCLSSVHPSLPPLPLSSLHLFSSSSVHHDTVRDQ